MTDRMFFPGAWVLALLLLGEAPAQSFLHSERPFGNGADMAIRKNFLEPSSPTTSMSRATATSRTATPIGKQHRHHPGRGRSRCLIPYRGSSYYSVFSGIGYPGVYYGVPDYYSFYDPYTAQLERQNEQLRRQMLMLEWQQRANEGAVNKQRDGDLPDRDAVRLAQHRQLAEQIKARELIRSGKRLFAAGNHRLAIARFEEASRRHAEEPTPHFFRAQALFAMQDYAQAALAIKTGLTVNPDWLQLDFDVYHLYRNPEELRPQIARLASHLKANPLDREALFVLAFELFLTDQKDKARTILEQVARLEPDDTHLKPFFDNLEALNE